MKVAMRCGAKSTILTHFSSRYDKVPEITSSMKEGRGVVAFDFMSVGVSQLAMSSKILEAL